MFMVIPTGIRNRQRQKNVQWVTLCGTRISFRSNTIKLCKAYPAAVAGTGSVCRHKYNQDQCGGTSTAAPCRLPLRSASNASLASCNA